MVFQGFLGSPLLPPRHLQLSQNCLRRPLSPNRELSMSGDLSSLLRDFLVTFSSEAYIFLLGRVSRSGPRDNGIGALISIRILDFNQGLSQL